MTDKSVGYANISIYNSFLYNSTIPVANYPVPEFNQGHGKTTHRKEVVEASGPPWTAAFAAVLSKGSIVSFKVKVATRVRSQSFGLQPSFGFGGGGSGCRRRRRS